MRGIPSLITDIRKQVFAEVARMAYSGDYTDMEDIPSRSSPARARCTANLCSSNALLRANACASRWVCPYSPCRRAHF